MTCVFVVIDGWVSSNLATWSYDVILYVDVNRGVTLMTRLTRFVIDMSSAAPKRSFSLYSDDEEEEKEVDKQDKVS